MFYFSLARELGMTVKQLLSNIDSAELSEWMAFFGVEREIIDERRGKKGKQTPDELSAKILESFKQYDEQQRHKN